MFSNPFTELALSPGVMQTFAIVMILLVVAGTIFDVIHKKSAKYFFDNASRAKENATRTISGGEKASVIMKTVASDVLTSSEFCSQNRRIAHLLTMYGFIIFVIATAVMIFSYAAEPESTPGIWPFLWHVSALMIAGGGYWFWFFIRVDVVAEGSSPFKFMKADLFVLSLIAMSTFAILWSLFSSMFFFVLFIISTIVLFAGVPWSKFAHMFFKPAAAIEKHLSEADGSLNNLPPPADAPAQFGLGIKRSPPRNY